MSQRIVFKQRQEFEGDDGTRWDCYVDDELVVEGLRNRDLDVSDHHLDELWDALDVEVEFEELDEA